MPPPSDIVKVAIEWPGANAQLLEIDQVSCGSEKQGEESGDCMTEAVFRGWSGVGTSSRKAEPCPAQWKVGHHGLGEASSLRKALREEIGAQAPG